MTLQDYSKAKFQTTVIGCYIASVFLPSVVFQVASVPPQGFMFNFQSILIAVVWFQVIQIKIDGRIMSSKIAIPLCALY